MPTSNEPFWNRLLEVWDVLAYTFDFEVFPRALDPVAYASPGPWLPSFVVPGATVSVVARDGIGGVYVYCERVCCERGHTRCCLHIDTRGHAVWLGDDLEQALALVIALPYWPELLAQCPSGELSALREQAQRLEREACDDVPALPAARRELCEFLEMPELRDPVRRLHQLAIEQSPPLTVWSPLGWQYESPTRGAGPGAALARVRTASGT